MLEQLPVEVLEIIVAMVANDPDIFSPLSALLNVFLVSSTIYHKLFGAPECGIPVNHALLATIFASRFDLDPPERRLNEGRHLTNKVIANELKRWTPVLRRVINGEIHGDLLVDDLAVVYLMLLGDDGKNMQQLEHAGTGQWVKDILKHKIVLDEDGWPKENGVTQLAAAILSIVCDRNTVSRESQEESREIIATLHPFLVAGHRYPITSLPITHHEITSTRRLPPEHTHTFLTMASMPIYPPMRVPYFGRILEMSLPLISESAICATYIRNELVESRYSRNIPLNREEADVDGYDFATQADWQESNLLRSQGLGVEVPRVGSANENLALLPNSLRGSERWDIYFQRLTRAHCALSPDPTTDQIIRQSWYFTFYKPGDWTGNWLGRLVFPNWEGATRMIAMHPSPLSVVDATLEDHQLAQYFQPMQITLREHLSCDHLHHVSTGDATEGYGVQNGWFPSELDQSMLHETRTELLVRDPRETVDAWALKRYTTWYPGIELPAGREPPDFPLAVREDGEVTGPDPIDEDEEALSDIEMDIDAEDSTEAAHRWGKVLGPHPDAPGEQLTEYNDPDSEEDEGPKVDVIITGETDYVHGKAWGAFIIYGRIRPNDGTVVLVRVPKDPQSHHGRWIFRGNLRAGHHFVGRWRETGTSMDVAGYEGSFVMSKVGEAWGLPDIA